MYYSEEVKALDGSGTIKIELSMVKYFGDMQHSIRVSARFKKKRCRTWTHLPGTSSFQYQVNRHEKQSESVKNALDELIGLPRLETIIDNYAESVRNLKLRFEF